MAPREEHGSTLSAHRAFVVHFGAGGGPGRRRFSGRVEHLSSGESMRFTSLKGLLAFFATALDVAAGAARAASRAGATSSHRGRGQCTTAARSHSTVLPAVATGTPPTPKGEQAMSTKLIGFVSVIRPVALVDRLRGSFPAERREAMKRQIQWPLGLHRIVTAFCLLLTVGLTIGLPVPPMAHAALDQDISLNLVNFSQNDPRWRSAAIGPNQDVTMYQCGSFLAVLGTFLENTLPAVPHFPVVMQTKEELQMYTPVYLDIYLRKGPDPTGNPVDFQGYKPGDRNTCAMGIRPGSLENVGSPLPARECLGRETPSGGGVRGQSAGHHR
jgi:hypothetical protein